MANGRLTKAQADYLRLLVRDSPRMCAWTYKPWQRLRDLGLAKKLDRPHPSARIIFVEATEEGRALLDATSPTPLVASAETAPKKD